jgi:cytochrome c-type biogenesis protein CcmH/NrfF
MKLRTKTVLLLLVLTVFCLGQGSDPLSDPRVRRVGNNLLCLCGCFNTVTSCNMIHCHYSDPARARIAALVKEGKSDQEIWDIFAKENGKQAVLTPPTQGFYLVNWVMPGVAAGLGLLVVWFVIRRLRRRPRPAPVAALTDDVLNRYQTEIEKETSKLE